MQGLKEAYVKENKDNRTNIINVVLSGGNPQYTLSIDRRHLIDIPNIYKASYYSITISPEINDVILFKNISVQGTPICKLVPCLMHSGSLENSVPYIQKLVDFLYIYIKYMTGKTNDDILIEANRICQEFNLSSLRVINTVTSFAKGMRLNMRPFLTLRDNTYTREEVEAASKSYIAEYKDGLDNSIKAASKTGAIFTRSFMREYIEQYTHFLTLTVSCEKLLKTTATATTAAIVQ